MHVALLVSILYMIFPPSFWSTPLTLLLWISSLSDRFVSLLDLLFEGEPWRSGKTAAL